MWLQKTMTCQNKKKKERGSQGLATQGAYQDPLYTHLGMYIHAVHILGLCDLYTVIGK